MDHGSISELSPRERRHQRTQQAILDAARRIISQQGINSLSMRAIANAIDYSPAGLYEYFGGKEEIVSAVCAQGYARLAQSMGRADASQPPDVYLIEIGLAYIDFAVRNPDHFRLMFDDPSTAMPATMSQADVLAAMHDMDSSFGLLLRAIQRGIDQGVFRTRPGYGTLEMAHTAWSLVHGMAMLRTGNLSGFPMDFAAVEREGLRLLSVAFQAGD